MAYSYVCGDRSQLLLLPPDLHSWLPSDHLAWFVLDVVDKVDSSAFDARHPNNGAGRRAHGPEMLLALLMYSYANNVRSSRRIESPWRSDIAYRVICANLVPDHATISRLRSENHSAIEGVFVDVLVLCAVAGLTTLGTIAIDGTTTTCGMAGSTVWCMATRSKVELFEQIRKTREREGLSVRGLARRFNTHRRTVRLALTLPVPPPRKPGPGRVSPVLDPWKATIDGWLETDKRAPKKQRHTARRIWQRLVEEQGADVGESTVRRYVGEARHLAGVVGRASATGHRLDRYRDRRLAAYGFIATSQDDPELRPHPRRLRGLGSCPARVVVATSFGKVPGQGPSSGEATGACKALYRSSILLAASSGP